MRCEKMNSILGDFLALKEILNSFNGLEKEYNWLLTNLDGFLQETANEYFEDYRIFEDNSNRPNIYWIKGRNLEKLANHKDVFFIWGVFSAFDINEMVDLDNIKVEPYADGNPNFWVENPKIQHPEAVVELVLWDSSLILLLSKDNELSKVQKHF